MRPITYVPEGYAAKVHELSWQAAGLAWTASGFGAAIPSRYMIRLPKESRWRRVYVTRFSNAGSAWVKVKGERRYLRDTELEMALARAEGGR